MKGSFQASRARFIRVYHSISVQLLRYLFLILGLSSLLLLLLGLFWPIGSSLTALAIFFLSPMLLFESVGFFVSYLSSHPEFMLNQGLLSNPLNRLDFLSHDVLVQWQQNRGLEGLLIAFFNINETKEVLLRLGLTDSVFKALPEVNLNEQKLAELVKKISGQDPNTKVVSAFKVLLAVLTMDELKDMREERQLDTATLDAIFSYYAAAWQRLHMAHAFWLDNDSRTGGIGKGWAVSYTTLLDRFTSSVPANIRIRTAVWPLFSRKDLVGQMITELNKAKSQNLLLVGEPGSGKQELFLNFAKQVIYYQTKSDLDGKEVRLLDVQRLLAEGGDINRLQVLFDSLFAEIARSEHVILFIDPIVQLLGSSKPGQTDVSNILQAHLNDDRVHIIGSISPEDYLTVIKPNQLLGEQFSVLELPPPSSEDLLPILLSHLNGYENRYRVFFNVEALEELIKLANRYIKDKASPARELDLLEEVAAANHALDKLIVEPADVQKVVGKQAEVPLQVGTTEQQTLLNLEQKLHERVIGQTRAIKQVSDALLRARAGLSTGNHPIGTFLFLGPTGVGKTETAKALSAIYFGSEKKIIRLDMTEYADDQGLAKLLGSDPISQPGSLTVAIQENPSSVVLFDEFEKASLMVKNVLLQLLDEGRLTTNYGKVLDFTNAIIIATSNAGSDFIKAQIEASRSVEMFEKPLIDKLINDKIFSPELLNRFDGVIVFTPLSKTEIERVVDLQVQLLKDQVKKDKGIELEIAPPVVAELAIRGYDPVFGARALERVIKNDLETVIAKQIVAQDPKPGTKLIVTTL